MEKIFNAWSVIAGILGGLMVSLFGGFDMILKVLLVMIALDYLTGIIKAIYNKQLSSNVGFKGLLKKIVTLIIVCVATVIQRLIGDNIAIREIVIMFYIANEGISLLENAAEFVPLPDKLKDVLLQLRGEKNDSN